STTTPPPRATPFPYTPLFRSHLLGLKGQDLKGLIRHDIIYPQREIIEVKAPSKAIPLLLERIVEPLSPDLPVDIGIGRIVEIAQDRKSTRLNSSHVKISYAVF